MAISNPSAIRKKNIEERTLLITALPAYRCDMFLRPPTGAGVIRQDHFQRHRVARSQCREARLDHARDTRVGDLAGERKACTATSLSALSSVVAVPPRAYAS